MRQTLFTGMLFIGTLCCVLPTARGEAGERMRTEIYPLADDIDHVALKEFSEAVVAGDGHVFLQEERGRLIIATTDAKHAELKTILSPDAFLPSNIRISVSMKGARRSTTSRASVDGSGSVVFQSGRKPSGRIVLNPEIAHRTTRESNLTQQQLLVADGRTASLRVGESVPYIEWLMDYGWQHGLIEQRINWQEVGSFLAVRPRILADGRSMRITLTPQLRGLVDGNPYRTTFIDLATEVIAYDGETVRIGGSADAAEFYERFLIGYSSAGIEESLNIELTPHIEPVNRGP